MTFTAQITKSFATAAISREAAIALIAASLAAADEIGFEAAIAITDAGGHLKAFERTDKSPFLAAEVAIDKAWTAVSFGLPSHMWASIITDPQVAQLAHRPRLVAVGGGFPIFEQGRLVGGLGISGGTAVQDQAAANKALAALGFDALS